ARSRRSYCAHSPTTSRERRRKVFVRAGRSSCRRCSSETTRWISRRRPRRSIDMTAAIASPARFADVVWDVALLRGLDARARAEIAAEVCELPLVVLRRALGRTGGAEIAERFERALRRTATVDLLRASSFARALDDRDLDLFLDAATYVDVPRGEHVYREGE